jgi:pimeloyl-ACP methyl ester carboxylesterase
MSTTKTIRVSANGIDFVCLEAGEGPLLLALHGFPDNAETFRHQTDAFVAAGYRVVAPYLRGYAPTSAPADDVYQTAALGRDVLGLIEALGADKATVIGHDWGAIAAYAAAALDPARIERLVAVAVPAGPGVAAGFLTSYEQQRRSWYTFFFQLDIADFAVANDDFAFIRKLWGEWSPGWQAPTEVLDSVVATLGQDGSITHAIAYYRAMFGDRHRDPALAEDQGRVDSDPINVPTLYVHGRNDGCMGLELADGMETIFPAGLERLVIEGAGHFLHQEKPQEFNEAVLRFLGH